MTSGLGVEPAREAWAHFCTDQSSLAQLVLLDLCCFQPCPCPHGPLLFPHPESGALGALCPLSIMPLTILQPVRLVSISHFSSCSWLLNKPLIRTRLTFQAQVDLQAAPPSRAVPSLKAMWTVQSHAFFLKPYGPPRAMLLFSAEFSTVIYSGRGIVCNIKQNLLCFTKLKHFII